MTKVIPLPARTSAGAFVSECARRGISLSLLPPLSSGEPLRIRYRSKGALPPKVRETIQHNRAAIAAVLEAESGVWHLPDGRKLYRHGESDWRYVPPGADPADHIDNFPAGYQVRQYERRPKQK